MAHWRTFAPRDSMGAWDLDGRDRHVKILAIKKVRMAGIPGMKDGEKAHIYTENAKHEALKPLIAGATILSQIAQATGEDDVKNWPGKVITLYASTTRGQAGGQVDCIRVRPHAPKRGEPLTSDPVSRPVDEGMRANQREQMGDVVPDDQRTGAELSDADEAGAA